MTIHISVRLAWHDSGTTYHNLGETERAIADYDQALQLNPEDATVRTRLGDARHALDQHQAAIDAYQQAIERDPQFAWPWNGLAEVYVDLGQLDKAIPLYQESIKLEPATALNEHVALGVIAQHRGNDDKAQTHFTAALDTYDTAHQQGGQSRS